MAEYYLAKGTWPEKNSAIGLDPATSVQGRYVSSVQMADGGINVTFGSQGHTAVLGGHTVGLTPALNSGGDIVWRCGNAAPAIGIVESASLAPTTVERKFLPTACR